MPKKETKRTQKEKSESKGISWKAVAAILGGITTLMGGVVTWLDFIVHVQSGYKIFLWAGIVVFVVVWFIILWLLYKQRNYYGYIWFAVTVIAGVGAWYGWSSYVHAREEKLIVLIANFDDTKGDYYALRNEIVEKLTADFAGDDSVSIETVNEIITPGSDSGSPRARELGKSYQADVVIWGWYRTTENPNITIHIENLSLDNSIPLKSSSVFQPNSTLDDLESFSFQQQAGQETTSLIAFFAGFINLNASNYETAIGYFDQALKNVPDSSLLIDNKPDIYFYRSMSYYYIGEFRKSLEDASLAIQLFPKSANAFYNRGVTYAALGNLKLAIQDFDQALIINPSYENAYFNLGVSYGLLKNHEQAIKNYDNVLSLNPQDFMAYGNRGIAYFQLGNYDHAIEDFSAAIQANPENPVAYRNRGEIYNLLGKKELAEADFAKYKELTGQDAP